MKLKRAIIAISLTFALLFGASYSFAQDLEEPAIVEEAVPEVVEEETFADTASIGIGDDALAPEVDLSVLPEDKGQVDLRLLSAEKLDNYKNNELYNYDKRKIKKKEEPKNTVDRTPNMSFFDWLFRDWDGPDWETFFKGSMIVIVSIAVILVIMRLMNINLMALVRGESAKIQLKFEEVEENIHAMDLNSLLQEALAQREYRKAIRLCYLRSLKTLADKKLIDWRSEKTNHDYLYEIKNNELRRHFSSLTLLFEIAWYSNRPVNEKMFEEADLEFKNFNQLVAANR